MSLGFQNHHHVCHLLGSRLGCLRAAVPKHALAAFVVCPTPGLLQRVLQRLDLLALRFD